MVTSPTRKHITRARTVLLGVVLSSSCTLFAPGEDEFYGSGSPSAPDTKLPAFDPSGGDGGDGGSAGSNSEVSAAGSIAQGGEAEVAGGGSGGQSVEAGAGGHGGSSTSASSGRSSSSGSTSGGASSAGTAGAAPVDPCDLPARACSTGDSQSEVAQCGTCGTGQATRTRPCRADCTWGAWSELSACQVTEECKPSDAQTRAVGCPCGGTKNQARSCTNGCTWGGWSDTSACNLECCSEVVYCNAKAAIKTTWGTWCRRTNGSCSQPEVLDDCMQDVASVCGSVQPEFHIDY